MATIQAEKGFARQPGQLRRIVEKIVGRIHNFALELIKGVDALRSTSLSGHFDVPGACSVSLLNACRATLKATLQNQQDELLLAFKEIGYQRVFCLHIWTSVILFDVLIGLLKQVLVSMQLVFKKCLAQRLLHFALSGLRALPAGEADQPHYMSPCQRASQHPFGKIQPLAVADK